MRLRRISAVSICFLFFASSIPTLTASTQFLGPHSYDTSGENAVVLVVADVNGDGKPDLVVANNCSGFGSCYSPDSIVILLGNGDGTFQPAQPIPLGQFIDPTALLAVADLNGDGKLDIVAIGSLIGVFFGNGDGTFQPPQLGPTTGQYPYYSVVIRDINADGKADLLVAEACATSGCGADGTVAVLLGNGDGTFQAAQNYDAGGVANLAGAGKGPISLAVADVNGDGKLDLLTGISGGIPLGGIGEVGVLLGNGDGTFQPPQTYKTGGFQVSSIAAADINGDGKQDAVVSHTCAPESPNCSYGSISILAGNGDGTFQAANVYNSSGYSPCCVAIGDVTRDGKPDIVFGIWQNDGIIGGAAVWINNGDGTFLPRQIYSSDGEFLNATALADVNGDGKLDLLVTNATTDFLKLADANAVVRLNDYFAPTGTTVSSAPTSSVYGQSVTLTAIVKSAGIDAPTGKVTFLQNGKGIGSAATTGGTAQLTTNKLAVGSVSLAAMYLGDNFAAKSTSAAIKHAVSQAQVTMTLTSTPNPSIFGKSVKFTATFTSTGGLPTGTVTFSNGLTTLGTVKVSNGRAVFSTTSLPEGSNDVSATYEESVDYSSASGSVVQVVN